MPKSAAAETKTTLKQLRQSSPRERLRIFRESDDFEKGYLLLHLPPRIRINLLKLLKEEEIVGFLNHLDPDKATDLLQSLDEKRAREVSLKLNERIKEKVAFLLKFNPRSAAGVMSLNYIIVEPTAEFGEASTLALQHEERTGKFPTILVMDAGRILGELPIQKLITHHGRQKIERHIKPLPTIKYDKNVREVVRALRHHPHNKIVVLDDDESVLGIIHSDDLLDIINEQKGQSLYAFAGVHREEDALDPALTKVRFRYRWLILNLVTAFLAASVVGLFENTIARLVVLAVYMPIVAGMGGNAGTQAMAVMVRALAYQEMKLNNWARVLASELGSGLVNGLINGTIVSAVAFYFNHDLLLGLVLGSAMVINLTAASFFGALIPLILKASGNDPASSASVFITTATDVIGFFVFLGLATVLLL